MASIREWLDSVKPGYGNKFTSSIEAVGAEDASDIVDLGEASLAALESRLHADGALPIQLEKIQKAMAGMSGTQPSRPGVPAPSADTPLKSRLPKADKQYACFLSHHKASCAMEARFLKEKLQALLGKEVFLDSDDLKVRESHELRSFCGSCPASCARPALVLDPAPVSVSLSLSLSLSL